MSFNSLKNIISLGVLLVVVLWEQESKSFEGLWRVLKGFNHFVEKVKEELENVSSLHSNCSDLIVYVTVPNRGKNNRVKNLAPYSFSLEQSLKVSLRFCLHWEILRAGREGIAEQNRGYNVSILSWLISAWISRGSTGCLHLWLECVFSWTLAERDPVLMLQINSHYAGTTGRCNLNQ